MPSRLIGVGDLERQLAQLSREGEQAARAALTRLTLETREHVQRETAAALEYSSPQTQRFVAAFRVSYSFRDGVFAALIFPMQRSAEVLRRHVEPFTNTPGDGASLEVEGKLAIPIAATIPMSRTGRVPGRWLPERLLARGAGGRGAGFINRAGTALMVRTGPGQVAVAYALRAQTRQPQRLDVPAWAARAVRLRAVPLLREAIERAFRVAGVK